jgi:hypothetical protein
MECRLSGETEVLGENLPQLHFCPSQNPTWPDPGSNPGRRGGKPMTTRLSYGAALSDTLMVPFILGHECTYLHLPSENGNVTFIVRFEITIVTGVLRMSSATQCNSKRRRRVEYPACKLQGKDSNALCRSVLQIITIS